MVYAVGKRKCLDPPTKNVVDGLWLMGLAYRFALDRLFRERGNVQVWTFRGNPRGKKVTLPPVQLRAKPADFSVC